MSRVLHVTMPELPDPRQRMMWDALAVRLDVRLQMHLREEACVRIHYMQRSLVMPRETLAPALRLQHLRHDAMQWQVLHMHPVAMQSEGGHHSISGDILSGLMAWTGLVFEDAMHARAADGTLAGASYGDVGITPGMLGIDFIGELAALIAHALALPMGNAWDALAPGAPYAVVTTFDCDGFLPGQPASLRKFLDRYPVQRPTLFMMALGEEERALFDPRYDPADRALAPLLEVCEPGLHSSYLAYHDGALIAAQKTRLEEAVGREVHGHRSHYLRFEFPYTWGYVAKAGFDYDMTMGFYDLPGHRQGGSHPIPLADPSGRGRLLWSWGVGLMDQHMFMPGSPLAWNGGKGSHALGALMGRLKARGGVLVLDWHVHCIDAAQFAEHYVILEWIMQRAVKDKAWIGGAGALLDAYRARKSAKALVAQVATEIRPSAATTADADALHAGHYVQGAGEANVTSVQYIDAGAASFLSALPPDAQRIADIGCGSGWISNRVPAMRQVIGVDIDAGITERITRRAEVGQLPNLPLGDEQADLLLCTDVLEHLTPDELKATGEEFGRVGTRYAYLQTPYKERLADGERHCDACGTRWHVNHHLASYEPAKLAELMPADWYAHTVTYTGEAWLVDSSLRDADGTLLGPHPMVSQRFTCSACGTVNEGHAAQVNARIGDAVMREHLSLPHYSEVAVLAARHRVTRLWDDTQPMLVSRRGTRRLLPKPHRTSSHSIDFSMPVEEMADTAPTYQVPCVVLQHALLQGARLVTSALADTATLFMLFPDQHEKGERFVLSGVAHEKMRLSMQAFNWKNDACGMAQAVVKDEFRITLELDAPAYCVALYVPNGAQLTLHRAVMSGPSRPLYCYDMGASWEYGHVELQRQGTKHRWLVPPSGRIWADRPLMQQVAALPARPSLPDKKCAAFAALGMEDGLRPAISIAHRPPVTRVPFAAVDALLTFAVEQGSKAQRRSFDMWLQRHDQQLARMLRRLLPRRGYLALRALYIRILRYLTSHTSRP